MHALATGGAGFIGSHPTESLLGRVDLSTPKALGTCRPLMEYPKLGPDRSGRPPSLRGGLQPETDESAACGLASELCRERLACAACLALGDHGASS